MKRKVIDHRFFNIFYNITCNFRITKEIIMKEYTSSPKTENEVLNIYCSSQGFALSHTITHYGYP